MPNVTYVSYLFSSVDDKESMAERVAHVKPLLNINAFLILFVDEIYGEWLRPVPANVKLIILDLEMDLATISTIRAAHTLKLPPFRNEKDTYDYLSFLNCKAELLTIARPNVLTPYIAYIDAGISKHLPNPTEITDLDTDPIVFARLLGSPLVLETSSNYEMYLWNVKESMLSSAFFILAVDAVDEWYRLHMTALKKHLSMGRLTWDVNIWATFLPDVKERIVFQTVSDSAWIESFGLVDQSS